MHSRQPEIEFDVLQRGRLLHHVVARQIVAALLERVDQELGGRVAVGIEQRALVAVRVILRHEVEIALHPGVVLPGRIGGILAVVDADDALGGFKPRRLHHRADRGRVDVEDVHRLPAELVILLDRLRRLLGRRGAEEQVGAGIPQLEDLRIDGRVGDLVGGFRHDHGRGLVAEAGLQPIQVILAEVVVLVEHADLGIRILLQNVLAVDAALDEVVRIVSHRPGEVLGIGEPRRAGGGVKLRHLLGVEVFLHGGVRRCADDLEGQQHFVAFDQLAHLLDGFRRAVGVIILNQVDLAAVDAARIVDHLDIGRLGLADGGIRRCRPGERHGLPDLDFGIACARVVFLLRLG